MKARISGRETVRVGIAWLSVVALAWGCTPDNSIGGDTVLGTGGSTSATGGSGTGGTGTGGSGTGGSGTGGSVPTGSGGVPVGTGGVSSSGGAGSPDGGVDMRGGTGGMVGSMGGAGPIVAGGDSKCTATAAAIGKLCDGFEGAAPGTAMSSFVYALAGTSTAVVDTTKPYRGTKSVHIKSAGQAYIRETATFTQSGTKATNNEMWGRIFIWFSQTGNPQSHDVFITLEDPTSSLMAQQYHVAGGSRGLLNSGIRFDTPPGDHYQPAMGTGMINYDTQTPQWHCWEWHTTAANASDFYVDGTLYAMMSVTASMNWPLPIFKSMSLGFMEFGATPATELWIDEVAVDTARIGCDN